MSFRWFIIFCLKNNLLGFISRIQSLQKSRIRVYRSIWSAGIILRLIFCLNLEIWWYTSLSRLCCGLEQSQCALLGWDGQMATHQLMYIYYILCRVRGLGICVVQRSSVYDP